MLDVVDCQLCSLITLQWGSGIDMAVILGDTWVDPEALVGGSKRLTEEKPGTKNWILFYSK